MLDVSKATKRTDRFYGQGVADANAARNSIAKDYMKKCDCIWILAPITRYVFCAL